MHQGTCTAEHESIHRVRQSPLVSGTAWQGGQRPGSRVLLRPFSVNPGITVELSHSLSRPFTPKCMHNLEHLPKHPDVHHLLLTLNLLKSAPLQNVQPISMPPVTFMISPLT